jgi:prepilin-type processing-associated H-X9-DG protein
MRVKVEIDARFCVASFIGLGDPDRGFNMAFCDGSVQQISYTIDATTHANLANRKDGVPIDAKKVGL